MNFCPSALTRILMRSLGVVAPAVAGCRRGRWPPGRPGSAARGELLMMVPTMGVRPMPRPAPQNPTSPALFCAVAGPLVPADGGAVVQAPLTAILNLRGRWANSGCGCSTGAAPRNRGAGRRPRRGDAGKDVAGDVADAVAAGLDAVHVHVRPAGPSRRRLGQRDPVVRWCGFWRRLRRLAVGLDNRWPLTGGTLVAGAGRTRDAMRASWHTWRCSAHRGWRRAAWARGAGCTSICRRSGGGTLVTPELARSGGAPTESPGRWARALADEVAIKSGGQYARQGSVDD